MANAFRVSEALERQIDIYHYLQSRDGGDVLSGLGEVNTEGAPPDWDEAKKRLVAGSLRRIINSTPTYLTQSDAYYIDSNICDLCRQSSASLPDWTLYPEFLPSPRGFALLERPGSMHMAGTVNKELVELAAPIHAFQWSEIKGPPFSGGGIYIVWYAQLLIADRNNRVLDRKQWYPVMPTIWAYNEGFAHAAGLRHHAHSKEWLRSGEDLSHIPSRTHAGIEYEYPGEAATAHALAYIAAFFSFTKQRILVDSRHSPDHIYRKSYQARRIDWKQLEEIRVITLRKVDHKSVAADGAGEKPDWQFRFAVSGHWRNQYYPSRKIHQPVWINGYIKGNEALPLKPVPMTVFNVSR